MRSLAFAHVYLRLGPFSESLNCLRLRAFVCVRMLGVGKRGLLEKGSLQKSPFSRDSREFREILEILENPQTVENKGESDHFLEILEILENLDRDFRDSRDSSSKTTLS